MLGDYLYQLSARDLQAALLELVHSKVEASVISASVDAIYTVPLEHVLILQQAFLEVSPGAGQGVIAANIAVREKVGVFTPLKAATSTSLASGNAGVVSVFSLTAGLIVGVDWSGETIIGPEAQIIGRGAFSAAVAANASTLSVHGILIPRGNIAL